MAVPENLPNTEPSMVRSIRAIPGNFPSISHIDSGRRMLGHSAGRTGGTQVDRIFFWWVLRAFGRGFELVLDLLGFRRRLEHSGSVLRSA